MNIQMPDKNEKRKSIDDILDQGMPESISLPVFLRRIYKDLGIRYIFNGLSDVFFLGLVCAVIIHSFVLMMDARGTILFLFIISPICYALLSVLTMWKEMQLGTFEVKMTCRYTLHHLTAFRMLCFSSVNILLCMVTSAVAQVIGMEAMNGLSGFRLFAISLSSLFLYAGIAIAFQVYVKARWVQYIIPAIWVGVIGAINVISGKVLQTFIERLPLGVCLIVIVIEVVVFTGGIKRLCFSRKRGDNEYAYN